MSNANYRAARMASIVKESMIPWYAGDALFVESPFQDTDTAQVDPIVGGVMTLKSASPAAASGGFWDMTGSNYGGSSALTAGIDASKPFLVALAVDKNNHVGTFNTLLEFGSGTDNISFSTNGTPQPEFKVSLNSGAFAGAFITQATWSAKGTALIHWLYCNLTDATNTFLAGVNTTTTTSSGVLALPSGRTVTAPAIFGNTFGTTTGTSSIKQGIIQVVNRAGMSFADAQAIVAKMKTRQGI